jgi:hypothetical protein
MEQSPSSNVNDLVVKNSPSFYGSQRLRFQVLMATSMNMSSGIFRRVVWYILTDVSEVLTVPITRAISASP